MYGRTEVYIHVFLTSALHCAD